MKMTGPPSRRMFLASAACFVMALAPARARLITGGLPWQAGGAMPPRPWRPGPWLFFTSDEAAMVESIVGRLIPADELGAGGKDAGCAIFIDRQLAGPYGHAAGLYMRAPFAAGTMTQGNQDSEAPATRYRQGLKGLGDHVRSAFSGRKLSDLSSREQDDVLEDLEAGKIDLKPVESAEFFNLLLQNTMEGYFADPIYGGNRDMAGWKLVGFPGTRYDYRDWVDRHNERYPLPPVGIMGRPDWNM